MKSKKQTARNLLLIPVMMAIVFLAAACSGKTPGNASSNAPGNVSTEAPESGADPAEENRTLTIGTLNGLQTLDYQNSNSINNQAVLVNMFDSLFIKDEQGAPQPKLVEQFENVDDVTWRFTLKQGIKFHNGDSLTANDVKFSIERVAKDNKLTQYSNYSMIKEVKVTDDYHFDIITDGPDPAILSRLASQTASIFPKNYFEEATLDGFLKQPVGSGPYQFVENKKDDRLVLKKFDGYFDKTLKTDWDTVIFRKIPESSTRVAELLTGGIDIAEFIPPAEWDRVKNTKGLYLPESDSTRVMSWQLRSTAGTATADVRVRQAIDYAIDNKAISDQIFKGKVTPMRTLLMPGMTGADESLYNTYRYDLDKAKQLLKEAGYENGGPEITIQAPQDRYMLDSDVTQLVGGMLQQAGFKVKLDIMDPDKYRLIGDKNKEMLMLGRTNSLFDAVDSLKNFDSKINQGTMDYTNPEVDELLKKAAVNMNPEERAEQYKQVQQIVAEEVPYVLLYNEKYFTGVKDTIDFKPRLDQAYYVWDIKMK